MLIDYIISSAKIHAINSKFNKIKELNDKIKEKLIVTRNNMEDYRNEEEAIILKKLQLQHNIMKIKLYKQLIRLKRVFPTMKSDILNKIMNEKVDLYELKEKIKSIKADIKVKKIREKH